MEKLKIFKNPLRLALKMYILIWVVLLLQILLKVTFNYWKPYVIPTEQLQNISDYIDSHKWLKDTLDGVLYLINALLFTLCAIQQWWFRKKWHIILSLSVILLSYVFSVIFGHSHVVSLVSVLGLPLVIDYKKWLWVILTFVLSDVFMVLSLWLEGISNTDYMNYIIKLFFQSDYYMMLVLNYILFNIIRMKKEAR